MKKPYVGYSKSETMIKMMKQIKDLYDPVSHIHSSSHRLLICFQNGIMNPYKYI
jgi:hypothetical protein